MHIQAQSGSMMRMPTPPKLQRKQLPLITMATMLPPLITRTIMLLPLLITRTIMLLPLLITRTIMLLLLLITMATMPLPLLITKTIMPLPLLITRTIMLLPLLITKTIMPLPLLITRTIMLLPLLITMTIMPLPLLITRTTMLLPLLITMATMPLPLLITRTTMLLPLLITMATMLLQRSTVLPHLNWAFTSSWDSFAHGFQNFTVKRTTSESWPRRTSRIFEVLSRKATDCQLRRGSNCLMMLSLKRTEHPQQQFLCRRTLCGTPSALSPSTVTRSWPPAKLAESRFTSIPEQERSCLEDFMTGKWVIQ
jgi:hypothetical protein